MFPFDITPRMQVCNSFSSSVSLNMSAAITSAAAIMTAGTTSERLFCLVLFDSVGLGRELASNSGAGPDQFGGAA